MLAAATEVPSAEPALTVMVTMSTVSMLTIVEAEASAGVTVTKIVSVMEAEQVASASLRVEMVSNESIGGNW